MISKWTPELTALRQHYITLSDIYGYIGLVFLVIAIVVFISTVVTEYKQIDNKQTTMLLCVSAAMMTISIIAGFTSISYNVEAKHVRSQNVSLLEIKDKIKIEQDKMTIEPLDEDYSSIANNASANKPQVFRIEVDPFYTNKNAKLIDKDGQQFDITRDELTRLKESSERK